MNLFDNVRERFTVDSVFTLLTGDEPGRSGFASCPFCGSRRFQITGNGTSWTCWAGGCQEASGRDAVGLAALVWKVSRYDAARRLLSDDIPVTVRKPRPEAVNAPQSEDWNEWAREVNHDAQKALWSGSELSKMALEYLTKQRGLSRDAVHNYGLGLISDWTIRGDWKAAPGILIPWTKPGGFTGGNVREFHKKIPSKYMMISGSRREYLWPGPPCDSGDGMPWKGSPSFVYLSDVVMTEGEFDAMAAQEHLAGLSACMTLGSSGSGPKGLCREHRTALSGFRKILIASDADEAGERCWDMWHSYTPKALKLTLPDGCKDLGEAHVKGIDLRAWYLRELERLGLDAGQEPGCYDADINEYHHQYH